jgi:hypothetical protein
MHERDVLIFPSNRRAQPHANEEIFAAGGGLLQVPHVPASQS